MARAAGLVMAVLTLAAPPAARAVVEVESVRVVGRVAADAPWTDGATEARLADRPELMVIGIGRERARGRARRVVLVDDGAGRVELGGRRVAAAERVAWARVGEVRTRWLLVEP